MKMPKDNTKMKKVDISSENKAMLGMVGCGMILDDQGIIYESGGNELRISHFNPIMFAKIPEEKFGRRISIEVPWDKSNGEDCFVMGGHNGVSYRKNLNAAVFSHDVHGELYIGVDGLLYQKSGDDGVCAPVSKRSCRGLISKDGLIKIIGKNDGGYNQ